MANEMLDVLLSIRPEWCGLILSGEKTFEIRKNRPRIDTPFRCHIYLTKPKDIMLFIIKDGDDVYGDTYHGKPVFIKTPGDAPFNAAQKVFAGFTCDHITPISNDPVDIAWAERSAKIKERDLIKYFGDREVLYGWHISDLEIYKKPMNITEFYQPCITDPPMQCDGCYHDLRLYSPDEVESATDIPGSCFQENCALFLKRPPQSWCYVRKRGM